MPLLECRELKRSFGGLRAVDNVSFVVEERTIQAVIGPNGAGKTTLFNLITGTLPPSGGRIFLHEQEITGLKPHQIAYRGVLRTFQNLKLAGHMTALENVMVGRHTRSRAGFFAGMLNLPRTWKEEQSIRARGMQYLDLLEIGDLAGVKVENLPFGKQRAVELARALAAEPELLLLDEPASGLNIHETEELAELIVKIKDRGVTVLLVEHDMSLVMDICDRVAVLNFGKLITEGSPSEVQRNREVIDIYLGGEDA